MIDLSDKPPARSRSPTERRATARMRRKLGLMRLVLSVPSCVLGVGEPRALSIVAVALR